MTVQSFSGPILHIGGVGVFFGAHFFFKKKGFCLLEPSKKISFLTNFNENGGQNTFYIVAKDSRIKWGS